jgi:hypothetical protein
VETVRFAFDGTDYEIDLNAKNAAVFGKQLASYIEHARRAGGRRPAEAGGALPVGSALVIPGLDLGGGTQPSYTESTALWPWPRHLRTTEVSARHAA